jgi:hypothetical protein
VRILASNHFSLTKARNWIPRDEWIDGIIDIDKDKDTFAKHDRVELLASATSGGGLCECECVWCICDTVQS